MTLLRLEGLSVDIPVAAGVLHAVRDVDLSLEAGEITCIVGESGCGKSLTSLALMGLLPSKASVSARRLEFDGRDLLTLPAKERAAIRGKRMAMIFQEPMTSLNPSISIGEQLMEMHRRHLGKGKAKARERALFLLQRVGIAGAEARMKQYPHELSGGLRQRVMIAMALMCNPSLLIADEPTTALDVTIQAQILRLLADLRDEFGLTIAFITHDLGIVARIADRVVVMYGGEVVEMGTARQVLTNPTHPYTAGLISCIPRPGSFKPSHRLGTIPGRVPAFVGNVRGCGFRNRCPYVVDACAEETIALTEADRGHLYRCLREPGLVEG